jgi:methylenetetrahydrofolate reductase (NADPH)
MSAPDPGATAPSTATSVRTLRGILGDPSSFARVVELITNRGPLAPKRAARTVALAKELSSAGLADAFSITDNPGGVAKVAPEALGLQLLEARQQVIIHLSCKDLNRTGLESRAWTLASLGFDNILAISGDLPAESYKGHAGRVFDVDSVGLIGLLRAMDDDVTKLRSGQGRKEKAGLYVGAAVTPFKYREDELVPQYFKLKRKLDNGAQFLITQTGFDSRKFDELLRYMEMRGLHAPTMANIFVLTPNVARYFHKGMVPGVSLSDELMAECERQAGSADAGKAFFHQFAAKQIAIAKGLGYRGAYLSGHLTCEEYQSIFGMASSYSDSDWPELAREIQYAPKQRFYLLARDWSTGLNRAELSLEYQESTSPQGRRKLRSRVPVVYRVNRLVHSLVFQEGKPGYKAAASVYKAADNNEYATRAMHVGEQAAKIPLFGCRDCGDCSLPEMAYLCPEAQCAKNQRNGPCGGSTDGLCESAERECVWARAYNRLKPYGEEATLLERPVAIKDAHLRGTASWANFYLKRDHTTKKSTEQPE